MIVVDITSPDLDSPIDFVYEQRTTGNQITWTVGDINPHQYRVDGNGTTVGWTAWTNGTISFNVDGLTPGVYNHTITVTDDYGNEAADTVLVTVLPDSLAPDLDSPIDFTNVQGTTGNQITWTVGDINPHQYRVDGNGTTVGWTAWTNGTISFNVDGITPGIYNYTITVTDDYGNVAKDTVLVTVLPDSLAPDLDSPIDFTYEQGITGNQITWTVGDINPHQYRVDGNWTTIGWTAWTNGTISLNVDGITPGIYNHTITVTDDYGNEAKDTVFVTVEDSTPPDLDSPADFSYGYGTIGNQIVWTVGDLNPHEYRTDGNATTVEWTVWSNGSILVNVDSLTIGVFNCTITAVDDYGNEARDTVLVFVIADTTPPNLDSPDDFSYELGTTGQQIVWTAGDINPGQYIVGGNGTSVNWTAWTNGTITVKVDGLGIGVYNFTITVRDSMKNEAKDIVFVTVVDTTPPDLDSPIDLTYELGSTGNQIVWNASDISPGQYRVDGNGSAIGLTVWTNGTISFNVDGLNLGFYNHTITVADDSGNEAKDTVYVIVVDTTSPDIDSPADIEYVEGATDNHITWTPTDLDPASYEVLQNGTPVVFETWDGSAISIDVVDLAAGVYNYTLVVADASDNKVSDTVMVTVTEAAVTLFLGDFGAVIVVGSVAVIVVVGGLYVRARKR